MAGSPPNFHKMDSRSGCIQDVLKVKVKVKGHVIRTLSWILGMSYSVIDGLVIYYCFTRRQTIGTVCIHSSPNKDPKIAVLPQKSRTQLHIATY